MHYHSSQNRQLYKIIASDLFCNGFLNRHYQPIIIDLMIQQLQQKLLQILVF